MKEQLTLQVALHELVWENLLLGNGHSYRTF